MKQVYTDRDGKVKKQQNCFSICPVQSDFSLCLLLLTLKVSFRIIIAGILFFSKKIKLVSSYESSARQMNHEMLSLIMMVWCFTSLSILFK